MYYRWRAIEGGRKEVGKRKKEGNGEKSGGIAWEKLMGEGVRGKGVRRGGKGV